MTCWYCHTFHFTAGPECPRCGTRYDDNPKAVSTSVSETSYTLDGVRYVLDSDGCFARSFPVEED